MNVKIAISGKSGCGNTSVSRLLAETLKVKFINFTLRNLAEEKGISLSEMLNLASNDSRWDKEVDERQRQLTNNENGYVAGSRLAIWKLKNVDIKVYLEAKLQIRAGHILDRESGDLESIIEFTEKRDREDRERFLKIYGIDNDIYDFADIVINTDMMNVSQIADIILKNINDRKINLGRLL